MDSIKLQQIFINTDMRKGYDSLWELLNKKGYDSATTPYGQVFLFINVRGNNFKVVGNHGVFNQKLPANQSWDLTLRKDQLFSLIGQAFGLKWSVSNQVYQKAKLGMEKKNGK